ncbi:hypothetical protein [Nocardia sp. NPDC057030]|uniref:hypothetical protein n=1 Tax=unclassified Nocardia TaxID=2637762 RepID=UPI003633BA47
MNEASNAFKKLRDRLARKLRQMADDASARSLSASKQAKEVTNTIIDKTTN